MRSARFMAFGFAVITFTLIVFHLMNLPARSLGGWIAAARITKSAAFEVSTLPSDITDDSWTSMWGRNRPTKDVPHEILSELEVVVQHETRSGLVTLRITGDTEAEVDAFLRTIRRDFERTYRRGDLLRDPVMTSRFRSSTERSETDYYWRQKYLWLLGSGFLVSALIAGLLARVRNPQIQAAAPTQP